MKQPARLSRIEQARSTAVSIARFAIYLPAEIVALAIIAAVLLGGAA